MAATTTPQHHHVAENDDENDEMPNGDVSQDLTTHEGIVDPVEERRTLAERNERLHSQLKVMPHKREVGFSLCCAAAVCLFNYLH